MWAGQAAGLGRAMPARELTRTLVNEAQALMKQMAR
jgi:nitronate monooxygenase